MKDKNLSYRRQDVLFDVRKIQSEYIPKRTKLKSGVVKKTYVLPKKSEARRKKEKWFNEVFEPFRKANGLNSKEASRIIRQETKTSHKLIADIETGKDYSDRYRKVF